MPTISQCEELISHTNYSSTTINGVVGYKFVNKNDTSKYIFIPRAGRYSNGNFVSNVYYYWTSNRDMDALDDNSCATCWCALNFDVDDNSAGLSVRPVVG